MSEPTTAGADEKAATQTTRIADVLAHIEKLPSAPGSLLVGDPAQPLGRIFVERNRVCWASAKGLARRLLDILRMRSSMQLNEAQMKDIYARCRSKNEPIGEALVKLGAVTPAQLRASLHQHTAESLLRIDEIMDQPARKWPLTWLGRAAGGHSPRFTFATAHVLAAVGAALTDAARVEVMTSHLDDLAGIGCSAVAFSMDGTVGDAGDAPLPFSISMAVTLLIDEVFELTRWAHTAFGASPGFSPVMVRALAQSASTGAAVGWIYEGTLCAAITPHASSLQRLVSYLDKQALPVVLSTTLVVLERLRERGVGG